MYYLENKGPIKGLLIIKESEIMYKLSYNYSQALQFTSRYKANQYKRQNKINNNFRIIKI